MKTFICIAILLLAGLTTVSAQSPEKTDVSKKAKDRLFPEFAQDIARLKAAEKSNTVKPPQALITSPQALRDMIFPKNAARGAGAAAAPAPLKAGQEKLPSAVSSAEAIQKIKEAEAASKAKITVPNTDQGSESDNSQKAQKPKN